MLFLPYGSHVQLMESLTINFIKRTMRAGNQLRRDAVHVQLSLNLLRLYGRGRLRD